MKSNVVSLFILLLFTACANNESQEPQERTTAKQDSITQVTDTSTIIIDTSLLKTPAAPEEVVLQFNLQKGKAYVYDMLMDFEQETEGKKMSSGLTWRYRLNVTDEKNTIKTIRTTYERIAVSLDMGGQKLEFSSDNNGGDPTNPLNMLSNMFSALKGKSFFMKVDEKGAILEIDGLNKIGEAMIEEMNVPEQNKKMFLKNFTDRFNAKEVRETFGQAFSFYPGKKVKSGDSWKTETSSKIGPLQGNMITTYRLKRIDGNKITLVGTSTIDPGKDNSEKGTQTAQLLVDAKTGLVLQNVFETKINGNNKISGKGKISGKEIPL